MALPVLWLHGSGIAQSVDVPEANALQHVHICDRDECLDRSHQRFTQAHPVVLVLRRLQNQHCREHCDGEGSVPSGHDPSVLNGH